MKNKESVNKNQTEKKKLPSDASAFIYDRDKNLTYWPKDESVEPPDHESEPTEHLSAIPRGDMEFSSSRKSDEIIPGTPDSEKPVPPDHPSSGAPMKLSGDPEKDPVKQPATEPEKRNDSDPELPEHELDVPPSPENPEPSV